MSVKQNDVTGDLLGTSGGGAVIYPVLPPPISTPLSSNGNGGDGGQHRHVTDGPM